MRLDRAVHSGARYRQSAMKSGVPQMSLADDQAMPEVTPGENSMTDSTNNFALLLDLAREKSSEKRRELLHTVTEVFLSTDKRSDREAELF
jgi:hypothetical protein